MIISSWYRRTMKGTISFTEGKILGPLMKFSVPVILALVLQSLYGAVDLLVVGQYASSADVSAVATGSQVMNTVTGFIAGLSMGTTILLGHQIGEGKKEEAGKSVGTAVVFFITAAAVIGAVLLLNNDAVVRIMKTPAEAYDATSAYIRVCSWGLIFIGLYNLIGSLFRGLGNSRIPLIAVAIAAFINIFGDLYMVAVLHMGAKGAAIATIASQMISVIISYGIIRRIQLPFEVKKEFIRFDGAVIQKIIHYGLPLALSDTLVGVSFLVVTSIVNALGVIPSAGVGVAEKVCNFIMLIPSALSQAMAAFIAQNYGARKLDRAHAALRYGIEVSFALALVMAWLSFFHGDLLCRVFSKDPQVISAGWEYLKAYALDCIFTSIFFCMNGYFNGCGETKFVMAQSIIGAFGVRVPVSYLMSKIRPVSLFRISLATPASSLFQVLVCIIYFFSVACRKEQRYLESPGR
jgi:putative MATE family efflux protein